MSLWQRQEDKIRKVRENNKKYREALFERELLRPFTREEALEKMKIDFITKISNLPKHYGVLHSFSQLDGFRELNCGYAKSMKKFVQFMNLNPEPGLEVWIDEKVIDNGFCCWRKTHSIVKLNWKVKNEH